MINKLIEKILNFIEKNLFKNFFQKKIYLIGHSHIINIRKNYEDIKYLNDLDYKIFSQNGEDGIIDYFLHRLKIDNPKFVEIGVGDYTESNTRFLFETSNSKGLIIDCIDEFEKKLKNINLWKGDLTILNEFINDKNIIKLLNSKNFLKI